MWLPALVYMVKVPIRGALQMSYLTDWYRPLTSPHTPAA